MQGLRERLKALPPSLRRALLLELESMGDRLWLPGQLLIS